MKIRWTSDSLRLRITPSEMALILSGERVTEKFVLSGSTLWQVSIQPGDHSSLASEDAEVVVHLSPRDRQMLGDLDTEGIYFQNDENIRYFIEKDFPCAHPRAAESLEPLTETFDAPGGFARRKQENLSDGK